jgi:two-component system, NtrC family, sensor kinase
MSRDRRERPRPEAPAALHSEPVPSAHRAAVEAGGSALDELLQLALDLPIDVSEDEVIEMCVTRLSRTLPDSAVGLIVQKPGNAKPRIVARLPGGTPHEPENDRLRLFPEFPEERVVALVGVPGSTLHVAGTDLSVLVEALLDTLIARGSEVVAKGILRARSLEQAQREKLELRRLQAQFIQTEKLASLGQIVAGVVHELNNPLTSIVTYSEHLRRRGPGLGSQPTDLERVQKICEAAERILRFSRDLVGYARPARHEPGSVQLREVIEKALVFCEHEFVESAVRIEKLLPHELPTVHGVYDQLTQVFVNLFTNAAHAMNPQGGTLRIAVVADYQTESVHIEVADEGVGIDDANVDQIFEPFFTTKPDGQGTGLGLAIVREIIKAHGGSLKAQNRPNHGTVFSLALAMSPGQKPPSLVDEDLPTRP